MQTKTILSFGVLVMLVALESARSQEPQASPDELPRPEQLTKFDPLTVQIQRRDGRWTVEASEVLLKDCGRNEEDARKIWTLIRQLRLDHHGVIGSPQAVMEYWLSEGAAPQALPRGLRVLPLNPGKLQLQQSQGFWVLGEQARVLFNFGHDETEAKQALAVIRKYGFDRIGIVGQAVPSMLILASSGDNVIQATQLNDANKPADAKKPEVPSHAGPATFYPTPILPALAAAGKQSRLVDRGRPGKLAVKFDQMTATANVPFGRYPFDFTQARVVREDVNWILTVGSLKLANFGQDERAARVALAALMHFRLTEMITVGSGPEPVARYYLSSGQAPRGLMVGVVADHFSPDQLAVRTFGDRHYLAQGSHPVLDCGKNVEEAEFLLAVVKKFGFDHIHRIGRSDNQSMMIFVRSH